MNLRLDRVEDWLLLARQANWSVAKLAKLKNVSTRTLERHFHDKFDTSPRIWLTQKRQLEAIKFLANGRPVKEASISVGYKHATHFTRAFKKYCGVLPSQHL